MEVWWNRTRCEGAFAFSKGGCICISSSRVYLERKSPHFNTIFPEGIKCISRSFLTLLLTLSERVRLTDSITVLGRLTCLRHSVENVLQGELSIPRPCNPRFCSEKPLQDSSVLHNTQKAKLSWLRMQDLVHEIFGLYERA